MRVAGNATYGVAKQVYVFGGLNYGDWYGSDDIESLLEPGISFQLGAGFKFHKRANLELQYTSLNNEGSRSKRNYDVTAKGLMIQLNTPFSFNLKRGEQKMSI